MFSLHSAVFPLCVCIPIDFNSTLTSAGPNIGKDPLQTSQKLSNVISILQNKNNQWTSINVRLNPHMIKI